MKKVFNNRTLSYEPLKRTIWTDNFVNKILALLKKGYTYSQIAKEFDISLYALYSRISIFRSDPKWAGKIPYIKYTKRPAEVQKDDKIGILDIEVWGGFDANKGFMIAYCIKEHNKDKYYSNIIDPKQIRKGNYDKDLCNQIVKDILRFDVIVGYYSGDRRFDIPYVRTRCAKNKIGFPFYNTIKQIDLYPTMKNKFKLDHCTLREACKLFGLKEKGFVDFRDWASFIYCGDKKMGRKIKIYNSGDSEITDELFNAIHNYDSIALKSI